MTRKRCQARDISTGSLVYLVALAVAGAPSCDGGDHVSRDDAFRAATEPADSRQGLVVAEVAGAPILAEDVADLVAALDGGIGPEEALRKLVDQELLAREAASRGWADDPAVAEARSRVLARRLLEREIGSLVPDGVPVERLREEYERQRARFDRGPARRVVHAVARSSRKNPAAARELAGQVAEAVAGASDEAGFREALGPLVAEHGKKRLVVETLPPFAADDTRFVRPFVEAAFAIEAPGRPRGPVETRFGWHVILLLEELPPVRVPFEEARGTLARELLDGERRARTERLLADLERAASPWIDEAALLPEGAP